MSGKKEIKRHLQVLSSLQLNSRNLKLTAENTVLSAFKEPKPLFESDAEKSEEAKLVEKSLPLLEHFFKELDGSLNPDLRQHAQRCRSGLQFLIDEFKDNLQVYNKLKLVLSSAPVRCVEEFIESSKDVPPEYESERPEDLSKIPATHTWWF